MKEKVNTHTFYCGQLTICPELGQIKTSTDSVRLGPINMRVLVVLLERQGSVVSRSELFDRVWKNQVVSDDVLTRCISDLRASLSKLSESTKVIETVPKKGYRWLPELTSQPLDLKIEANTEITQPNKKTDGKLNRGKKYLQMLVLACACLFVIAISSLWLLEKWIVSDLIKVALFPIKTVEWKVTPLAREADDLLRTKLLETKGIIFLSRRAVASSPRNPYPYLTREFGTHWIIEGQIRTHLNNFRISLSLVDARSATVAYSLTQDIKNEPAEVESFCLLFLSKVTSRLELNKA